MYKIPLTELKEKIIGSGKLNASELDSRIKKKINDLSGLISEEGAAHIIANELGVELYTANQSRLKLKEIYPGMRNVSCLGKVIRKFEIREFAKGDKTGKVASILFGDETDTLRLVFWNDQVEILNQLKEEDVLLVKEGYVKESRGGGKEIHLGERGEVLINPKGENVAVVKQNSFPTAERKKIEALSVNDDGIEIFGTIVQAFDPRFFNICPECGTKVSEENGEFSCGQHGKVVPTISYVMNLILDDGTGTIRGVFWKNQTNHLLGKNDAEMSLYKTDASKFEDIKTELLGEQVKLVGRVKKNDAFDRLEFNVQMVEKGNPKDEIAKLETVK